MARQINVLRQAEIAPEAPRYGVATVVLGFTFPVVTIPLLVVAYPWARWYQRRYYRHLSVTLSTREVMVKRGVWFRTESTVPLEKVTDVALTQGPVMRHYGVKGLLLETAGQTGAAGVGLLNIVGIVDADEFRDAILDQRDKVSDREDLPVRPAVEEATAPATGAGTAGSRNGEIVALLREIRDHVSRI